MDVDIQEEKDVSAIPTIPVSKGGEILEAVSPSWFFVLVETAFQGKPNKLSLVIVES